MHTLNRPISLLLAAAIAASAFAPVTASASADPAARLGAATQRASLPVPVASSPTSALAPLATEPGVEVAANWQRRAGRHGYRPGPPPRRRHWRRPPPRYVYRPPVRVWGPRVVYPGIYYRPIRPCVERVVQVRRNGRIVRTTVRCGPYVYGPRFYGGGYARY